MIYVVMTWNLLIAEIGRDQFVSSFQHLQLFCVACWGILINSHFLFFRDSSNCVYSHKFSTPSIYNGNSLCVFPSFTSSTIKEILSPFVSFLHQWLNIVMKLSKCLTFFSFVLIYACGLDEIWDSNYIITELLSMDNDC